MKRNFWDFFWSPPDPPWLLRVKTYLKVCRKNLTASVKKSPV